MWGGLEGGVQFNWGGSGANVDWGECGLGRCAIVGRIPYWGCKSNLCGADLEGGGASNLTGADRGRMWIGAVSPASVRYGVPAYVIIEIYCVRVRLYALPETNQVTWQCQWHSTW